MRRVERPLNYPDRLTAAPIKFYRIDSLDLNGVISDFILRINERSHLERRLENDVVEFLADSSDGETEVGPLARQSRADGQSSSELGKAAGKSPRGSRLPTRRSAQFRVRCNRLHRVRARARCTCPAHTNTGGGEGIAPDTRLRPDCSLHRNIGRAPSVPRLASPRNKSRFDLSFASASNFTFVSLARSPNLRSCARVHGRSEKSQEASPSFSSEYDFRGFQNISSLLLFFLGRTKLKLC